jgi:hypothetical protein
MSRRAWIIVAVAGALLLLGTTGALLLTPGQPQTISEATSPDKTWSVAVIARPRFLGSSYDIVVEVRDSQGKHMNGHVVDLTHDLEAARKARAVSFVDNNTAMVGNRKIEKPDFLRE